MRTPSRMGASSVAAVVVLGCVVVLDASMAGAVEPVTVTYATHVDHPLSAAPADLAVVDVNGDAIEDVVTVGAAFAPTVSVLLGDGAGGFAPRIDAALGAGTSPSGLAVGDLNGDDLVDVVISWADTNEVSVLQGDGTGYFGAQVRYATGTFPTEVVLADLDADDLLDIVTANGNSDSVSVLLGEVGGTFGPRTDLVTPDFPRDVVVADFDGDAAPDIAVAGGGAPNAAVLLGSGDGTFAPYSQILSGGSTPASLTSGDFDGDTVADLAISAGGVILLLGDGDGTFTGSGTYETGPCGCQVEAVDLNGDSLADVAVGIGGSPTGFEALLGRGDGTLAPRSTFVTAAGPVTGVGFGDLDDDGLLDVVVANNNGPSSNVAVLLNTPGLPQAPVIGTPTGGDQSATVRWTVPADQGSSPITGYIVTPFRSTMPNVALPSTTFNSPATTQVVTGLTNGSLYRFRVAAINATGQGQRSLPSTYATVGLVPAAPAIGTATAGDGLAVVRWTAPAANGGPAVTGYIVTPYIGYFPLTPVTFNGTATTRTITGLSNGTTYRFKVRAVNAVGPGAYSATSNAVAPFAPTAPGAPTIGTASAGIGNATVSWSAPSSTGGSALTGYVVTPYISGVAQPPRSFFSTATAQTITSLANGTTYTFRVAATNAVGTGAQSAESNAVTPAPVLPGAPTIGTAVAGEGSATVSWTVPASDGGSPITGYVVVPYIGYYPLAPQTFSSPATTQVLTGLTNGTTYRFKVRAVNVVGPGAFSTASNAVTPTA